MEIRIACHADLDSIEAIYDGILTQEEQQGHSYTNWQRGVYPTRQDAEAALAEGSLYVGEENGQIAAAVTLNHRQLPEYSDIRWEYPAKGDEVLVIHTLVIHPQAAGHGLGRQFVTFAEETARAKGCKVLRLDTYEGNTPAASLYRKLGYRYAGVTKFNFHGILENLILFEKQME